MLAVVLASVIYLLAGWQLSAFLPVGDEPHYLVIADSLRYDADLRIENNHRARHYLEYFPGEMKPDYLRRGINGQIYSIHPPGLPALLLLAYAWFGYAGAVAFLALLSAGRVVRILLRRVWHAGPISAIRHLHAERARPHRPGLTGLLFDQQFGLIPNAPIFLASVCGLGWTIFRKPRTWAAQTQSHAASGCSRAPASIS